MTDTAQRQHAYTIALQTLYRTRQREKGRRLLSIEMAQAVRDAEEFVGWYFGVAGESTGDETGGGE